MPKVEIDRRTCENDLLPNICMVCGEDTNSRVDHTFSWCPMWVSALLTTGPLALPLFFLGRLMASQKLTMKVPICREHRNHWQMRKMWSAVVVLGTIMLSFVLILIFRKLPSSPYVALTFTVILIAMLLAITVLLGSAIRPEGITDTSITLTNVDRNFIHALKEGRLRKAADHLKATTEEYDNWKYS